MLQLLMMQLMLQLLMMQLTMQLHASDDAGVTAERGTFRRRMLHLLFHLLLLLLQTMMRGGSSTSDDAVQAVMSPTIAGPAPCLVLRTILPPAPGSSPRGRSRQPTQICMDGGQGDYSSSTDDGMVACTSLLSPNLAGKACAPHDTCR